MSEVEMIRVPKHRYEQLLKDSTILTALYHGGVDNWEWYSESLRDAGLLDEEDEEEEDESI